MLDESLEGASPLAPWKPGPTLFGAGSIEVFRAGVPELSAQNPKLRLVLVLVLEILNIWPLNPRDKFGSKIGYFLRC
jgi:hypothetical protein